jgi:hypothetical protein
MSRRLIVDEIRLPSHEEPISAVTIFDGQGRVVRVVPGNEFRGPIVRRQPTIIRGRRGLRQPGGSSVGADATTRSVPA